ncbi:hypothetical protein PC116_g21507 [Phytophthora cactorum]|uniref:Uncharacterized protein n=1 Tax=Phytophthora cactorum TaxID=29920 RepID=A0A8T1BUI4_9STRA|nr:hypothetical protein Pcac1_g16313 [Phytophthora cactorum]KAG2886431.1 hypothetical protein PC114_g19260 [Phytophthora cactorum]KAG2908801.1 hypothetical protein PC117_g19852 [Phytophthora cactorum]KAG2992633.1 hypothetical protein PC119_g18642 [Phytophthora cactorum]KAG3139061.1 hypothetical protein C6341_g20494 [Phytophthora cactorum]
MFSASFWRTKHKLEAMGLERAERMYEFRIRWAIELPVAMVSGELKPQEPEKTCSTQLQKLLDAGVPYVVQKIIVQGAASFIETDTGPVSGLEFIDASLEQGSAYLTV